ncbi:MAG: HlyD family secretion protein, partial [Verrucomicrobiales bacterium]|nr:HlyD family secretion protein [Verrucomicrobiales bacterium]
VKLDERDYRAALNKADAAVAIQKATLVNQDATYRWQESLVAQAQAGVAAAEAETVRARDDLARYTKLSADSVISTQELQKADSDFKQAFAKQQAAQANLEAAKRHLEVLDTQKEQIQAGLSLAQADREVALLNLGYTEVRAPIDGLVGNKSAREGAYATTGSQVLSIVPAHGIWVDANFKESQIGKIRAGDAAQIKVDLLPGKILRGHVASIAPATGSLFSLLPPENATGNFTKIVQRVTVRILLDDSSVDAAVLRPGLSVVAEVETQDQTKAGL